MQSKPSDIRKELETRMTTIQKEIDKLKEEKAKIDKKLQDADLKLGALRVVYQTEAERFGEPSLPLFTGKGKSYRFAGMKITEALSILRKEQPEISKRQARDILEKEGFDFRGKRSLSAVHFAWVALERRNRPKQSRKGCPE